MVPVAISSSSWLVLYIWPTNIQVNIPPRGMRNLSVITLKKSKKLFPNILKSANGPNDNADIIPIEPIIIARIIVAFFLLTPKVSIKYAVTTSSIDIEDVIAAKKTSAKNNIANNLPAGKLSNTEGNVWKIKPGPAAGSNPTANTAGRIARPARRAIKVSSPAITKEFFGIFESFCR